MDLSRTDLERLNRIRLNHWLPKLLGAGATTPSPTCIYVASDWLSEETFKHESIHARQFQAIYERLWKACRWMWLAVLIFHIQYRAHYVWNLIRMWDMNKAYRSIPVEIQAYDMQSIPLSQYERSKYRELHSKARSEL